MVWNKRGHGTTWKVSEYGVFSSPYFSVFGLNTEIYGVNLRIHSEYRKIQTRKNSVFGFFSRSVGSSFCILHMYSLNLCITYVFTAKVTCGLNAELWNSKLQTLIWELRVAILINLWFWDRCSLFFVKAATFQPLFTCSKSIIEIPETNTWNLFTVNNKDTRSTSMMSFWCLW